MKNLFEGATKLAGRRVLAAVACVTLFAAFPAAAGIANTKHNLGSTGTGANRVTGTTQATGTDEVCVFCHTPHAADNTAPVPLWNKRLNTGATYTTYASLNTASLEGEVLPVGSVSIACLSCHDGTQAMDNIINAPGSGGLTADGGAADGLAWTWAAGARIDAGGLGRLTGVANLGSDLSNDHPIGVAYCGGGILSSAAGQPTIANCNDKDFVVPTKGTINTKTSYWVNTSATGGTASREKTDMILYTRDFAAGNGPSVECGSCHDPHVEETAGAAGKTFLRISNTGSGVCLACHVK